VIASELTAKAVGSPERLAMLISVYPRFASAILSGDKHVELRRVRPRLSAGGLVVLYATSPVKQILGTARLKTILEATPNQLWAEVGAVAGVTRSEFNDYFSGRPQAFGLNLVGVRRLPEPLSLPVLRENGIHPPQGFRYLGQDELRRLGMSEGGLELPD
jgi:predicted transcriptional regulator